MWEWIVNHSVAVLIISGFVVVLFLFRAERVKAKVTTKGTRAKRKEADRGFTITFWTIEGIAVLVMLVAFYALVVSKQGVGALITPVTVQKWFLEHGTSILAFVAVGAILWMVIKRVLPHLVYRVMEKPTRDESRGEMKKRADTLTLVFLGLAKTIIILLVSFMVLSELSVNIGPILAGLGIIGIAVGFGAQYLIRDLIAGTFILLENQYRVGDVVKVADIFGYVEQVNLRKTVLRDLDGLVHHVPNGEIRVASNATRHFSRVNLDVSVAYDTDLDHAISVINRVGQELADDEEWGKKCTSAPQVLRVNNFGDSGIDLKILGEVKPLEQWSVTGELRYRLKKAFDAEGIEIPWPHTKVYFGNSFKEFEQKKD